jgi:fatty-acyl-CoA synthase
MNINTGQLLSHRAMLSPNKMGLTCAGRDYTYAELNHRANRAAHLCEALGIRPGDRVGLLAHNGVEYFDLFFGLAKIGGILVPINYRLAPPEIAEIIADAGARLLIHGPEFSGLVEQVRHPDLPFRAVRLSGPGTGESYDDLMARSGTKEPMIEAVNDDGLAIIYAFWAMGRPRGVLLTHENFFWASLTTMATLTLTGQPHLLSLPLFHIGGLGWLPSYVHQGKRCVLMPRFDPDLFLKLIHDQAVSAFGVVPTMLHFLKESPLFPQSDFSRVQCILSYGQALPLELIDAYAHAGIRIRNLYGLTESAGPALVIDAEHALIKAGSVGLPFFHTRVNIVDDHGLEVPTGQTGEVIIAGEHVMKGYWNRPEATADAIRSGWLFTGDLARRDADGYHFIVDRKKEMIISGGENISPSQIEDLILTHPAVADVAVLGRPESVWGESVAAVVMKKPGAEVTAPELLSFLKGKIADYKLPRLIEFHSSLPRTLAGKMEKKKLRQAVDRILHPGKP